MSPEVVPEASIDQEVGFIFAMLFEGVTLSAEERAAVEAILDANAEEQRRMLDALHRSAGR